MLRRLAPAPRAVRDPRRRVQRRWYQQRRARRQCRRAIGPPRRPAPAAAARPAPSRPRRRTVAAAMQNTAFSPTKIQAKVGDVIGFTNKRHHPAHGHPRRRVVHDRHRCGWRDRGPDLHGRRQLSISLQDPSEHDGHDRGQRLGPPGGRAASGRRSVPVAPGGTAQRLRAGRCSWVPAAQRSRTSRGTGYARPARCPGRSRRAAPRR